MFEPFLHVFWQFIINTSETLRWLAEMMKITIVWFYK